MKKFFALLALVLGVVSCQTEPEGFGVNAGGEQDVNIIVSLPEGTRANANSAEGAFANVDLTGDATIRYILKIYQKVGDEYKASTNRQVEYSDGTSVVFPVRLVPNRDYRFVVWADYVKTEADVDNHYNTEDLANITLNDTWVAMDETRDAFTGYFDTVEANEQYTSASSINITLTRPFAKLRVITTDMQELGYLSIAPHNAAVTYMTQFHESFNAFNGEYGDETVSKAHSFIIKEYGDNKANESKVLFTDYFFADDSDVVKFVMHVNEANGAPIKSNSFNTDIAVKRNYLTTIQGNILTDGNNVTVTVNPVFDGETQWPDANKDAEQLAYAAMFGGEVTLTEDVTLTQPLNFVKGANAVINLDGNTLTGAIVLAEGAELTVNNGTIVNTNNQISGITTNGNLTLDNVNIESARHGVRVESGKVVINGGEYKVAPISNSTLHALNVGDNGTTAEVIIKGGTFIGPKGTMADSGSAVNVRNGSSVVIEGGNFSGGKTKTLAGQDITVKGGTFDQNPATYVAAGYKAIAASGAYYVLSETIANAAEAENVTTVTESTADVATALATNNGEATLFMWNDVAYIAKYGEVVITSDADEATTTRGVVESSAGLTNATVAEGIEVVGDRTFRRCANLETVALPNTLTEIGPAVFQSCSKLANITIPESVTTIGEGAFQECASLESINIPSGVTRIEKNVFRNTGLTSVEFHAGVTYFGNYAFRDCEELTEIIINAPTFTVESDTFLNAAGPFQAYVIKVANAEMKAYLESRLSAHQKTFITIVAPEVVNTTDELQAALAKGKDVVLANDLTITPEQMTTAPYGNKTALSQNGGVFDGNGKTITANLPGDNYIYMTNGGTTKYLNVTGAFRGVMIMSPTQTVYLENVVSGGKGVVYALNTGEGDSTQDLVATNCTFNGWSSWSLLKSATFTNCTFGQGSEYSNVTGRLGKPYVNTVFEGCDFCSKYYIDLSALGEGQKVTLKNCTVNGMKITANNWTRLVAPENTCGEGQISVELKNGTYLTAENVADYIIFE